MQSPTGRTNDFNLTVKSWKETPLVRRSDFLSLTAEVAHEKVGGERQQHQEYHSNCLSSFRVDHGSKCFQPEPYWRTRLDTANAGNLLLFAEIRSPYSPFHRAKNLKASSQIFSLSGFAKNILFWSFNRIDSTQPFLVIVMFERDISCKNCLCERSLISPPIPTSQAFVKQGFVVSLRQRPRSWRWRSPSWRPPPHANEQCFGSWEAARLFFWFRIGDECNIGKFFPTPSTNQPPIDMGFSGISKGAQIKGHSRHFVQESVKEKEAQVSKNQSNTDGLKAPWYHSQPVHLFRAWEDEFPCR